MGILTPCLSLALIKFDAFDPIEPSSGGFCFVSRSVARATAGSNLVTDFQLF